MRRHVLVGASFARGARCLGAAQWALDRALVRTGDGRQAPRFEVDPLWPKPLPNHWVLGADDRCWRSTRRITSGSCIAPIASIAIEGGRRPEAADRRRAAVRRRRSSSSIRRATSSATGAVRATATSGRRRITASSSTTRTTSGSAATTRSDAHILKFTQDGKFLMQFGTPGTEQGQQRHRELRTRREDLRRPEGERGVHRRRLRQQARRRDRRRHRQVQALLGRLRQQARRHEPRAATTRTRRRRSSSARRCTAPSSSNDGLVYVCDRPNDRIQVFKQGRHVREGAVHREARRSATARCGTSRSRRTRSRSISTSPTARTRRVYIIDRQSLRDPHQLRRRRPPARPVLRRPQHRDRFEGQHLHDRDVRGTARCRSSSTRDSAPVTKMDQGTVWPK